MVFSEDRSCADPEMGGLSPLENHKHIGFLSNTGPDSLKIHKAIKPAFNVGPTSARQRADNGPLIVLSGSFLHSSTNNILCTMNLAIVLYG